jgi:hypothetical protein
MWQHNQVEGLSPDALLEGVPANESVAVVSVHLGRDKDIYPPCT